MILQFRGLTTAKVRRSEQNDKRNTCFLSISSKKYFTAIEHENLAFPCLPDFIAIQQLELPNTLVVVVLDANASSPLLDLAL
jgi:hypothetical protein